MEIENEAFGRTMGLINLSYLLWILAPWNSSHTQKHTQTLINVYEEIYITCIILTQMRGVFLFLKGSKDFPLAKTA